MASESDTSSSDSIRRLIRDNLDNAVAEQIRRFRSENIRPSTSRSSIGNQYNPGTSAYATSRIRAPIINNWQPSSRRTVATYNPPQPVIRYTRTPVISNVPMHYWHGGRHNSLNPFNPMFEDTVGIGGPRIITLRLRHIGPPLVENFHVMYRFKRFETEFREYCDKIGLIFEDQRFLIDGRPIDLRDTPLSLGLQHGQTIEVFTAQGGPSSSKRKRIFTDATTTESKRFRSYE